MLFNLSIAAAVFIALYALTALIQAIRKDVRAGCWSHFLITVAILLLIGSFIVSTRTEDPDPLAIPIAAGAIIGLGAVSLVTLIIERRADQFAAMYSRALLGLGVSILLAASLFVTPILPQTVLRVPTSTPVSQSLIASSATDVSGSNIVPTQDAAVVPTDAITMEPTITRTPLPSPSPTRTRRAYVPPTITPTPELEAVAEACDARATVNLNVRDEPTTDSEVVAIIPEGDFVRILGRNDDSTWWNTEFQGERGWIFGDLIELDPICNVE
ncbi:MAG: SH3 domain-containing protein [Chloroflexota bacterium]